MKSVTTKVTGDAGEHYAISQFGFSGIKAAKMPDNWEYYDLIAIKDDKPLKVSVKTRANSSDGNPHFRFKKQDDFDWIVLISAPSATDIKAWVIPKAVALKQAYSPRPNAADQETCTISLSQLSKSTFDQYRNLWNLP